MGGRSRAHGPLVEVAVVDGIALDHASAAATIAIAIVTTGRSPAAVADRIASGPVRERATVRDPDLVSEAADTAARADPQAHGKLVSLWLCLPICTDMSCNGVFCPATRKNREAL